MPRLKAIEPDAKRGRIMKTRLLGIIIGVTVAAVGLASYEASGQAAKPAKRAPTVSFKEDVLPIFKGRCVECHAPGGKGFEASGLDLQSYAGVMKGTKFGPMVIAGDAQGSSLMALLDWRVAPQIRMPHGTKKLSTCDRDAIRRWIQEGALDN
jgi:mono/diheme cytochrome c family protein